MWFRGGGLVQPGGCSGKQAIQLRGMHVAYGKTLLIPVSSCLPEVHSIMLGFKVKEN